MNLRILVAVISIYTTALFAQPPDTLWTKTYGDYDGDVYLIKTFLSKDSYPGIHSNIWDGKNDAGEKVPPSIYFIKLFTHQYEKTNKIILIE